MTKNTILSFLYFQNDIIKSELKGTGKERQVPISVLAMGFLFKLFGYHTILLLNTSIYLSICYLSLELSNGISFSVLTVIFNFLKYLLNILLNISVCLNSHFQSED